MKDRVSFTAALARRFALSLVIAAGMAFFITPTTLFGGETHSVSSQEFDVPYPDTPEGVVDAFIKAGRRFDQIGQARYYADTWRSGYDCLPIDVNYRIVNTEVVAKNRANITVAYTHIGALCSGASLITRGKSDERVVYTLHRQNGGWEIVSPVEPPRISVQRTIQWFEAILREERGDPAECKETARNIAILKLFLDD